MSRSTSIATHVDPSYPSAIVQPLVRLLRRCSEMQRQVNRYH